MGFISNGCLVLLSEAENGIAEYGKRVTSRVGYRQSAQGEQGSSRRQPGDGGPADQPGNLPVFIKAQAAVRRRIYLLGGKHR